MKGNKTMMTLIKLIIFIIVTKLIYDKFKNIINNKNNSCNKKRNSIITRTEVYEDEFVILPNEVGQNLELCVIFTTENAPDIQIHDNKGYSYFLFDGRGYREDYFKYDNPVKLPDSIDPNSDYKWAYFKIKFDHEGVYKYKEIRKGTNDEDLNTENSLMYFDHLKMGTFFYKHHYYENNN